MEDEVRHRIMDFIIDIDEPFSLEYITYICKRNGIQDANAIKDVLDSLCEKEILVYSDKEKKYMPCA